MYEEIFEKVVAWKKRYRLDELIVEVRLKGRIPSLVFKCTRGFDSWSFTIPGKLLKSASNVSEIVEMTVRSKCSLDRRGEENDESSF